MRHLWQWLCGYVCVCVKGRQVNRFLNLCSRNGIHLWRIKYDINQTLKANLRLRDFYDIKPYLKKTKTCIRIITKKGFPFWCQKHRRLKWFICLIFLLICVGFYSLNFVWNIRINGNDKISSEEIVECLYQNNIVAWQKKDSIDCSNVEMLLRRYFKDLGWVSVYIHHTSLCIDVKESLYDEMIQEEDEFGKSYHLVADKDAVIYSIITREGKALVKNGMHVNAGDILVLGECEIFDDAGEVKEILYFPADALIYADVVHEFDIVLTEMEIMSLKIVNAYNESACIRLVNHKLAPILAKMNENDVIILDKNIIFENNDKNIRFQVKLYTRERFGINIPAEEIRENEFE